MKYPYHSTDPQEGPTSQQIAAWSLVLRQWQIAEHARQSRPYGMQRLLARAVWDQDGVRDEVRRFVSQTALPDQQGQAAPQAPFPVLIIE